MDSYSGTVESCYSSSSVSGNSNVGGLVGDNDGIVENSFWNTDFFCLSINGGGEGKTTLEMQTESTFTDVGWNFVSTWIQNGYPELLCMLSACEISLIDSGVPANEQGYSDDPAGDGIQNLLKYAIGLNPMEACSEVDVMEPVADETGASIIYNKSKDAEDVQLFPIWSDKLVPSNWNADGFEFEKMSETDVSETWQATHSVTGGCGYIRLKATTDE
jgi:hypothetical protein